MEDCGGLDKIEQLQTHQQESIYDRAVQILDRYFEAEDGEVEAAAQQGMG